MAPETTIRRALRLAPIMGITRVANVTGLDSIGVPVVMVCRPNSRSIAVSQGKGVDLPAAKASGLMESIEGYHAETMALPLRHSSFEELRYTERVVDVTQLPAGSTSLFHPNRRMLWCEGRDLFNDESVFVPYEVVHTDYTWPQPAGSGCFASTSNGLASGNHMLEAISHGVCEVIERDATALWKLSARDEQDSRSVDPATVDDPTAIAILEKFNRAGLETLLWETTSDVGIASFICVVFRGDDDPVRPLPPAAGAGCHPARAVALTRALTEAAQTRLTLIAGSRDDASRESYGGGRYDAALQQLRAQLDAAKVRRFADAPDFESSTLDGDVDWELKRLRAVGIERVIAVDLTKEFFNLPVVRIVVPGLEGHRDVPGYLPGARARAVMAVNS